jgi:hypothetical protein
MSFDYEDMSRRDVCARQPRNAPWGVLAKISADGEGRMAAGRTAQRGINSQVLAKVHVEPGHLPPQTPELLVNTLIWGVHSLRSGHLERVCAHGRCGAAGRIGASVQPGQDPPSRHGRARTGSWPRLPVPPLSTGHDNVGPGHPARSALEETAALVAGRASTHP